MYDALFLDFASRASFADAVNLYLRSGASDVGGYVKLASKQRRGAMRADLNAVRTTWKLD